MMRMLPIFATLDANSDGTISSDEINNATAALKKLDKNNDGKLDMMELRPDFAGRPGPPRDGERGPREGVPRDGERGPRDGERGPRETAGSGDNPMLQRLMQLDSDDNGELSADELSKLPERGERLMQFADRDKDGALSKEELQSMKSRGEEMRRARDDRN
jgi:Ca2+-binding EF-hand superfamily protein